MTRKNITKLPRREFVKTFVFGTVTSALTGAPWTGRFLAEINAQTAPASGLLRLSVSDYPALANVNGSIRVSVNPIQRLSSTNIKPDGDFYPIIVNRLATSGDRQFVALSSRCSHMDCVVGQYDALFQSLICPCHSSTYNIEGAVTGGPALATGNLTSYITRFDGQNTLEIEVPGLGYEIQGSMDNGETSGNGRFRLEFPTFVNAQYEILYFPTVEEDPIVINFSTTAGGPLADAVVTGDGQKAVVYVDRPSSSGFYRVSIKLRLIAAN